MVNFSSLWWPRLVDSALLARFAGTHISLTPSSLGDTSLGAMRVNNVMNATRALTNVRSIKRDRIGVRGSARLLSINGDNRGRALL
jgi:hypothetical protein